MSLADIEQKTQAYKRRRDVLSQRVQAMNDEIEKIKRRKLPGIKTAVAETADARSVLEVAISDNRDQFRKPRTLIIAGVRIGLTKGKGKIVYDDEDTVVERIEKMQPDQAQTLLKTTKKPIKKALEKLPAADLKALGCTVEDTDDEIVIKPTDGETDKIVAALLKDAEKMEDAA